jgi:ketosteroid isomerase-like protein
MPEESTTSDLVELTRRWVDAWNRRDVDALMALLAPEAAWDAVAVGYEHLRGRTAIRAFIEEWLRPYEEFKLELEELLDLGNGVAFMVVDSTGRLVGGRGILQLRFAFAGIYDGGRIVSVTGYTDVHEARAAAERLAEERAQADV